MQKKITSTLMLFSFCVMALALNACATARYVKIEEASGIVAIPQDWEMHREKAKELMDQKCPNGYKIVKEQEAKIGEDTSWGESSSSTTDSREWQITYQCK